MKTIKKIIALSLLLTLSCALIYAQTAERKRKQSPSPERKAEMMTKRLNEKLSLNLEQLNKVQQLLITANKNRVQIRKDNAGKKDEMRKAMKENAQTTEIGLKAILTQEQFAKYTTLKNEMVEKRKAKLKDRRDKNKTQTDTPAQNTTDTDEDAILESLD